MGDASDYAEVERFMRSPEGHSVMEHIRKECQNCRIVDVGFRNGTDTVHIELVLGSELKVCSAPGLCAPLPGFDLNGLRQHYGDVLQREYYRDFPERKPPAQTT